MFNSIFRVLFRSSRVSYSYPTIGHNKNVIFSPFSSIASKSISKSAIGNNGESFTTNCLIDTFGFSQEKASTVSKYFKLRSAEKAQEFVAFLENRGLTSDQILSAVRWYPKIAMLDPHKVLLPKIEFFMSLGSSQTEINNIICGAPVIFTRSLKNQIIPVFNYIKGLFDSNGVSLSFRKRLAVVFNCSLQSELIPNIEILRDAGVPDVRILAVLQSSPRTFMTEPEKFREIVQEVKQMNFDPHGSLFMEAVRVIKSMNKLIWSKKIQVYKKWGFSENDVILAFQRHPSCIAVSTDKLNTIIRFLVNEMGLDSSFVVKRPKIVSYSLEKRIKPRYSVYKSLFQKGLVKDVSCLSTMFSITEAVFLEKFVLRFEKEAPGLLQLYQQKLAISRT